METAKQIRRWTVNKEMKGDEEGLVLALEETTRGQGLKWAAFTIHNQLYDWRNPPRRKDDFKLRRVNNECFSFYVDFLLTGKVQSLTRAQRETMVT